MTTTIELLRIVARTSGPASRTLAAEAREIAARRGIDPSVAERFVRIEAKLDFASRAPTAAELAGIADLTREIGTA